MTELADLDRLVGVAAETCERVTGRQLERPDFARWPTAVDDEDSFRHLVSGAYVWLRELWPTHLNFFKSSAGPATGLTTRELRIGGGDVSALRTSHEHRLNPGVAQDSRTLRDVAEWMRAACGADRPTSTEEWRACGESLLDELKHLLREFVGIARAIEADHGLADQWRDCFAANDLDLVAVRQEVATDLGLHLQPHDASYLDRRIKQGWERIADRSARPEALVRLLVVRELVGWSTPDLPCDLEDLLDVLDLDPGRRALGAARLAYAVAEIVDFDSTDDLLGIVAEIWRQLTGEEGA